MVPFLAAMIFCLHPMQTMAVNIVTCRYDILCAFFYLLAVIFYLRARLAERRSASVRRGVAAAIFFVLALGSKPIAITLPGVILLYEAIFFQKRLRNIFFVGAAGLAVALLALLAFRGQIVQPHFYRSVYSHLLAQSIALCRYIRLFFLPTGLRIEYDVPNCESIWCVPVIASLILIAALASAAIVSLRRRRIFSLCVLWFFVTVSASSSIIPRRAVIYEYRAYLPSIGLCILAAVGLQRLARRLRALPRLGRLLHAGVCAGALLWLVALGYGTFVRNCAYWTPETLWLDNLEKQPGLAVAYNNIGAHHLSRSDIARAFAAFQEAIAIDPHYALAHNNLAMVYGTQYWRSGDRTFLRAQFDEARAALKWVHTSDRTRSPMPHILDTMDVTLNEIGAIEDVGLLLGARAQLAELKSWLTEKEKPYERDVRRDQIGMTTFYIGVTSYYAFLHQPDPERLREAKERLAEAREILGDSRHVSRMDDLLSRAGDERLSD